MTVQRTFYIDDKTNETIDFLRLKYGITLGEVIEMLVSEHLEDNSELLEELELFSKLKKK